MKIIDFHTHIYPKKVAQKATENICSFYGITTCFTGVSETLLEVGKEAGIAQFVLLPIATKPEQTRSANEFVLREVREHPEFLGFGTLHAETKNPFDEIDYIESSGLKGIKLHPDAQGFPMDDARMLPIYDRLQGRLPVLVHCGDPRYDYSHPARVRRILDMFPNLQIIAAHLGGWDMFDVAYEYLRDTNCWFDLSSSIMYLSPEKTREYLSGYGADRILFGTDFPVWDPRKEVKTFLNLDLSPEEMEKIAFRNAEAILGI